MLGAYPGRVRRSMAIRPLLETQEDQPVVFDECLRRRLLQ